MLLHFGLVGVYLHADAGLACLGGDGQAVSSLFFAEVDEEQLCGADGLLGIEVEGVEHVVDAVCTKGDAHTRESRHAEDASEVVVASAARDAAHWRVEGLDFKNGARVVVEASRQGEVQLNLVVESHLLECGEDESQLLYAFESDFRILERLLHGGELVLVCAGEGDDGLELLDGLGADAVGSQLLVDIVDAYLVQLVDGHSDVHNLVGLANHLSDAR